MNSLSEWDDIIHNMGGKKPKTLCESSLLGKKLQQAVDAGIFTQEEAEIIETACYETFSNGAHLRELVQDIVEEGDNQ